MLEGDKSFTILFFWCVKKKVYFFLSPDKAGSGREQCIHGVLEGGIGAEVGDGLDGVVAVGHGFPQEAHLDGIAESGQLLEDIDDERMLFERDAEILPRPFADIIGAEFGLQVALSSILGNSTIAPE